GLAGLAGVAEAHANYGTKRATVVYDPRTTGTDDFEATISGLGYSVPHPEGDEERDPEAEEMRRLRPRLYVAIALSIPVLLISMVPPLQFGGWQWVAFALATPVILWAGWPFHQAVEPRASGAARARRQDGASRERRRGAGREPPGRRPLRGAAGGEDRDRRPSRRRVVGRRHVDADGRAGTGRGERRRHGVRRDGEHVRPARDRGDQGRRGHRAGADRTARRRGSGLARAGAAAGRPGLGGLRA